LYEKHVLQELATCLTVHLLKTVFIICVLFLGSAAK